MADISLEKTLPSNVEAERALLGAILMDNAMPTDAKPEDLYLDSHRKILTCMREMAENNRPIELIGLKDSLHIKNQLEACGGAAYLASLTDGMPNMELAPQYIRIIKRCASMRHLIGVSNEIMFHGYQNEKDPSELISLMMDACDVANVISDDDKGLKKLDTLLPLVFDELDARSKKKDSAAYATGFYDVDLMMSGGVRPQDLGIVAGRPGHGKTAFTTKQMLNQAAVGINCAYFSLEMGYKALVERMIVLISGVQGSRLRTGFISHDDWVKIVSACEYLASLSIWIDDSSSLSVAEMRSRIRRIRPTARDGVSEGRVDLAYVDYLQLMEAPEKYKRSMDENTQTSAISKGLKATAKDMHMAIVAVSQLSRASERRTDRRPQLSDLRNSGQIEQDADWVQFVYREEMSNPSDENEGKASIILAKQRNGPVGDVVLKFIKDLASFENLSGRYE